MSDVDDLHQLEEWAGALLARLEPRQRIQVARKVGMELRRSQSQRIGDQRAPDGTSFIPRKERKDLRGKTGRIKRRRQNLFNKIRTARYLQVEATDNEVAVGFFGRIARIARVHQFGLKDRIAKDGPEYTYPARVLLGLSEAERERIRDIYLDHIS